MLAIIAVLAIVAEPASSGPETVPRIALEIANARAVGRSLIHLEDLIGPASRSIGVSTATRAADRWVFAPARAVLIVATAFDECADCASHFARLRTTHAWAVERQGAVIAIVLSTRADAAPIRLRLAESEEPFIIALDPYLLARRRLGLSAPGRALVIRSDGTVVSGFADLETATAAFAKELDSEKP